MNESSTTLFPVPAGTGPSTSTNTGAPTTDDESLAMLRAAYRAYHVLNNQAAILVARAQQALTTYQLAMIEEIVRRRVPPGQTIDINDGRAKPSADTRPWIPDE